MPQAMKTLEMRQPQPLTPMDTTAAMYPLKTQLIEQLIEENHKVIQELARVEEAAKEQLASVKHSSSQTEPACVQKKVDAACVMERLVADNAYYRKECVALQRKLSSLTEWEKRSRETLGSLGREKEAALHERRVLSRLVESLREEKSTLEFQSKHLGAAFLTLREATLKHIQEHPLLLETSLKEHAWEAAIEKPQFKMAVIDSVQSTHTLRTVADAVDQRLISLRLLDPSIIASNRFISCGEGDGATRLMGEKLVPSSEVVQLKKERQLWQRRCFKTQDEVVHLKSKVETLEMAMAGKDALLRKLQSQRSTSRTKDVVRSALRNQVETLQKELVRVREQLEEAIRSGGALDKVQHPEAGFVATPTGARTVWGSGEPFSQKMASGFLGDFTENGSSKTPALRPQRSLRSPRAQRQPSNVLSAPVAGPKPSTFLTVEAAAPPRSMGSRRTLALPVPDTGRERGSSVDSEVGDGVSPPPQRIRSKETAVPAAPSSSMTRSVTRQGIGTTVSQSEYQSPIAREIHILETRRPELLDTPGSALLPSLSVVPSPPSNLAPAAAEPSDSKDLEVTSAPPPKTASTPSRRFGTTLLELTQKKKPQDLQKDSGVPHTAPPSVAEPITVQVASSVPTAQDAIQRFLTSSPPAALEGSAKPVEMPPYGGGGGIVIGSRRFSRSVSRAPKTHEEGSERRSSASSTRTLRISVSPRSSLGRDDQRRGSNQGGSASTASNIGLPWSTGSQQAEVESDSKRVSTPFQFLSAGEHGHEVNSVLVLSSSRSASSLTVSDEDAVLVRKQPLNVEPFERPVTSERHHGASTATTQLTSVVAESLSRGAGRVTSRDLASVLSALERTDYSTSPRRRVCNNTA